MLVTRPERKYAYYVEKRTQESTDRPRRFLQAFAAALEHSSYGLPLDIYARLSTKCSFCAASCQLYETTGLEEDIPCNRSELLLKVYRRYFTRSGTVKARLGDGTESAIIVANRMRGGIRIENNTSDDADVQIGLNTGR